MMSNLGGYQIMTKAAKLVGGPENLCALVLASGYIGGSYIKKGVHKLFSINTEKDAADNNESNHMKSIYTVLNECTNQDGLSLKAGDEIRVLYSDNDIGLIEVIGDNNSPYIVSTDVLTSAIDMAIDNDKSTEELTKKIDSVNEKE